MNEKLASKSSLDLTLTQHPHGEDPKSWEVRACFQVDPPQAWYYHNSLNFRTLVILLQIDLAFSDEPKIVYEGYYETKNTSIFTQSSILDIGHYRWLRGLICWLPLNSKLDYLVRTIQRILDFL